MSVLRRTHNVSSPQDMTPPDLPAQPAPASPAKIRTVPRTRMGAIWAGIWSTATVFVALIVFMVQNTRGVEVSFLGLHGTLPLAIALLIALVGGILLTLVFGTARITQLRRLIHGRRD